jgi:hypothetical protein
MPHNDYGPWFHESLYKVMSMPIPGHKSAVFEHWNTDDIAALSVYDLTDDYREVDTKIYREALAIHQEIPEFHRLRLGIRKLPIFKNWNYATNTDKLLKMQYGFISRFKIVDADGKQIKLNKPPTKGPVKLTTPMDVDQTWIEGIINVWKCPVKFNVGGVYYAHADYSMYRTHSWGFRIVDEKSHNPRKSESQVVRVRVKLDDLAFIDNDYPMRASKVEVIEIIHEN